MPRSAGHASPRSRPRAFPRTARLLDGRAYDAVFGDNRRLADRYWTVLVHVVPVAANDSIGGARLGLAVAKKRARRAVDRNRIKRVARESFRHARAGLAGHHVVVMNRDAATTAGAPELRRALDVLWSRILRQSSGRRRRADRPSAATGTAGEGAITCAGQGVRDGPLDDAATAIGSKSR